MRDNRSRLRDMIQPIHDIENYAVYGKQRFDPDELIRVYVAHNLQILGLRHILVHGYFRVDYEIVWGVVEVDLPPLKSQLQAMLKDLEERRET
jgi:uncharacterized protein with HEPN domain